MFKSTYRSRRHRNAHTHDEKAPESEPFFTNASKEGQQTSQAPFFQTKLSVGQPGDQYEQEADQVANTVVNQGTIQQKPISSLEKKEEDPETHASSLQRKCSHCAEEEEKSVQRKEEKEEEETVQKKGDGSSSTVAPTLAGKIENSRGKGQDLPVKTKAEMQSAFGTDFSKVKVHTDHESEQLNNSLSAQAFTHRNDIYFNSGKYNPESVEGKRLLAHELTHVVQQNGNQNAGSVQRFIVPLVIMEAQRTSSGSRSPGPGIQVSWNGQHMSITANMEVSGPAATPEIATQIKSTIERIWNASFSDGYSVSCNASINFRGPDEAADSSKTQIEVVNEPGMTYVGRHWVVGSQYVHFNLFDSTTDWAPAHEFGHLIGLGDHYSEGVFSRIGGFFGRTRTAEVDTGWEGNLMAVDRGVLESKNIREWLDLFAVRYVMPGTTPVDDRTA